MATTLIEHDVAKLINYLNIIENISKQQFSKLNFND